MSRRSRLRIKITPTGYLFILLCIGIGIASLNTGNNLLYLIFSMMLSFIVLSGILSNNTLYNLDIEPFYPSRIFANQSVPVRFELRNQKSRFPSFSLTLSAADSQLQQNQKAYVLKIPPKGGESATDYIRFPRRGRFSLPNFTVETAYPFGLIRKFTSITSPGETIVYPQILSLDRHIDSDRRLHGDFLSGQTGGAANPYGIREFVYGDPARIIHWKTSARTGQLKVKEFEKEKRLRTLLDVRLAPKGGPESLMERALSLACTLLIRLSEKQFEVALRINGKRIEPKGRGYLDSYLTALALAQAPSKESYLSYTLEDGTIVISNRPHEKTTGSELLFFGCRELEAI